MLTYSFFHISCLLKMSIRYSRFNRYFNTRTENYFCILKIYYNVISMLNNNSKFFKFFKTCNWKIIALQYCVGFCQTSTWISQRDTYVPSLLHLHPTTLVCHRTLNLSSLHHTANPPGYPFYIWQCICFNATVSMCPILSLPPRVHKPVLYVWVSAAALQIGPSVPSFQTP